MPGGHAALSRATGSLFRSRHKYASFSILLSSARLVAVNFYSANHHVCFCLCTRRGLQRVVLTGDASAGCAPDRRTEVSTEAEPGRKAGTDQRPRSRDRGGGNSRRFPPGAARKDRSGRSVREPRRHPPSGGECQAPLSLSNRVYCPPCPLVPIAIAPNVPAAEPGGAVGGPSVPSGGFCAPGGRTSAA